MIEQKDEAVKKSAPTKITLPIFRTAFLKRAGMVTMVLLAICLLSPGLAPASDDPADSNGDKLREISGKMAAGSNVSWVSVCGGWEYTTVVGMYIWDYRVRHDACENWRSSDRMQASEYCRIYSEHCAHYRWSPNCMTTKGLPFFQKEKGLACHLPGGLLNSSLPGANYPRRLLGLFINLTPTRWSPTEDKS